MIVCPLGKRCCVHKTNKVQINPSNVCWWWYLGWCNEVITYNGKKPEEK